jgi:hypothetical protein
MELQAEQERVERDVERAAMAEETRLQRMMLEAEESAIRAETESSAQVDHEVREAHLRMEAIARESELRQRELEQHRSNLVLDRLREQLELAHRAGRTEEVRALERKLAQFKQEREIFARDRERQDRLRALQQQLEALSIELERLNAAGLHEDAADLERKIELLHRRLEERNTVR